MWTANILTLFPDLYPGPLGSSILGEARKNGKWYLNITDLKLITLSSSIKTLIN